MRGNKDIKIVYDKILWDPSDLENQYISASKHNSEHPLVKRRPRFQDNSGAADTNFLEYNMNTTLHGRTRHFIGEGPNHNNAEQSARYFNALFLNEVDDIIVAGDPFDRKRSGFLAYFLPNVEDPIDMLCLAILSESGIILKVKSIPSDVSDPNIMHYEISLNVAGKEKVIRVHQISKFADFGTAIFSDAEVAELLKIHERSKSLAIHCGAGLGRTGVMELAFCILDNKKLLSDNNFVPNILEIEKELLELRKLRPGFVQSAEQFYMAIELGAQLRYAKKYPNKPINKEIKQDIRDKIDAAFQARAQDIRNPQAPVERPKINATAQLVPDQSVLIDIPGYKTKEDLDYAMVHGDTGAGMAEIVGNRFNDRKEDKGQEDQLVVTRLDGFDQLSSNDQKEFQLQAFAAMQASYGKGQLDKDSGSTACVATAWVDNAGMLQCQTAHVGDSTAYVVIVEEGQPPIAELINKKMHNVTANDNEVKRIQASGRFIMLNRVLGQLAVTRAIGDLTILSQDDDHVPDIDYFEPIKLQKGQKAFLVVACDGLTEQKVLSVDDIGKIVANHTDSPVNAAQQLISGAFNRGSGSRDNISVAVVPITEGKVISAAVFDGHGGSKISKALASHFYNKLKSFLTNKLGISLEQIGIQSQSPQYQPTKSPRSEPQQQPTKLPSSSTLYQRKKGYIKSDVDPEESQAMLSSRESFLQFYDEHVQTIRNNLITYIQRIAGHKRKDDNSKIDFGYELTFFTKSRAHNREANYELARKLLEQLEAEIKNERGKVYDVISEANIKLLRNDPSKKYKLSATANFKTSELYYILNDAKHPYEPATVPKHRKR